MCLQILADGGINILYMSLTRGADLQGSMPSVINVIIGSNPAEIASMFGQRVPGVIDSSLTSLFTHCSLSGYTFSTPWP